MESGEDGYSEDSLNLEDKRMSGRDNFLTIGAGFCIWLLFVITGWAWFADFTAVPFWTGLPLVWIIVLLAVAAVPALIVTIKMRKAAKLFVSSDS